jgi:hypothetical protein
MRINCHTPPNAIVVHQTPAEIELYKKLELLSMRLRINQAIEEAAGISILELLRTPFSVDAGAGQSLYAYETFSKVMFSEHETMPS